MPQITKIRIVNVYYNNGMRLIPDELYDLDGNGQGLDTLFNLDNGGGKSVIVQFMMQPVKPKAMASDRKIAEYFTRPSDHSYVLLEWQKDGSEGKLLTGISIKARSADADDDTRGRQVNYYTFYTEYDDISSKYSIASLQLSDRVDGRYVPAEFDYVRKLRNKSDGAIQIYSSDENQKWVQKLSEYGIYQDEWDNVIQKLNAEEGGMLDFFDSMDTSDKLINRFFIPAINSRIEKGNSRDDTDASLSTMFINYSKKVNSKSDLIREQRINREFLDDLSVIKSSCIESSDISNRYLTSQAEGFAFRSALVVEKNRNTHRIDELTQQIDSDEKERHHIEYEQASKEYYLASDEYEKAEQDYAAIDKQTTEKEEEIAQITHEYDLMKCAGTANDIRVAEGEKKALYEKIEAKENNSDNAKRIADLKYTIATKTEEALQEIAASEESLTKKIASQNRKAAKTEKALSEKQKATEDARVEHKSAEKSIRDYQAGTDRYCARVGFESGRLLTGFYPDDAASKYMASVEKQEDDCRKKCADIDQESEKNEQEIDGLNSQIPEQKHAINELYQQQSDCEKELAAYDEKAESVRQIAERCSYRFEDVFTGTLFSYLKEEKENLTSLREADRHKLTTLQKKQQAVQEGHLHVIEEAVQAADSTGVHFDTVENYLTGIMESGQINAERLKSILEQYPFLAYSLLFDDEKSRNDFLDSVNRDEWIPAAVPLVTMDDMERAIDGSLETRDFLACYDASFFADRKGYRKAVDEQISETAALIDRLTVSIRDREHDIDVVSDFSYEKNWRDSKEQEKDTLIKSVAEAEKSLKDLKEKKESAIAKREELRKKHDDAVRELSDATNRIGLAKELLNRFAEEHKKEDERQELHKKMQQAEQEEASCRQEYEQIITDTKALEGSLADVENNRKDLATIKERIGEVTGGSEVEGTIADLYSEYDALSRDLDKEVNELKANLDQVIERISKYESTLQKMNIDPSEYKDIIYSSERMESLEQERRQAETERNKLNDARTKLATKRGRAENKFETAGKNVKKLGDEPLPKESIGTDFERRIEEVSKRLDSENKEKDSLVSFVGSLNGLIDNSAYSLSAYTVPDELPEITVIFEKEKLDNQWSGIMRRISSLKNQLRDSDSRTMKRIDETRKKYADVSHTGITNGLSTIENTVENGDYRMAPVACEQMEHSIELLNGKIESELSEITNDFDNLVKQCLIQGRAVYKNLITIEKNSSVKVFEDDNPKKMIRFEMPKDEEGLDIQAENAIKIEIEKGVEEFSQLLSKPDVKNAELDKKAKAYVGSEKLLHLYVGMGSIPVSVYKIDFTKENSRYRKWEEARKENSGGEKFVVFFTAIMSLMNYTRSENGIINRHATGVLLLDNPFGAITSKHLIEPVFRIAEHFHVQLICLSDITKPAVVSCFANVIRLVIKTHPGSSMSVVTHDGNSTIEHGYYKAMNGQLSFFDLM